MLLMFPGQGSQNVGMGKELFDNFRTAQDVFNEVDDAVNMHLSQMIFEGPDDMLNLTKNTQPAIMSVSMAFWRVLIKDFGFSPEKASFFAGHSLGEYSALCAAEVLSLKDTAQLLAIRGEAMMQACPSGGGMAAIIGMDTIAIADMIASYQGEGIVQLANDNANGQVVISGHLCAVQTISQQAKENGAKMAVPLTVSGPFHSCLMEPAVQAVQTAFDNVQFHKPIRPIISNVTAVSEQGDFPTLLLKQITQPVRWRESLLFAQANGATHFVEIGAGNVLAGLAKRTVSGVTICSVNSVSALEEFAKQII